MTPSLANTLATAFLGLLHFFRPFPDAAGSDHTVAAVERAHGVYECFLLRAANCVEGPQPACSRNAWRRRLDLDCVVEALNLMDVDERKGRAVLHHECGVPCKQE